MFYGSSKARSEWTKRLENNGGFFQFCKCILKNISSFNERPIRGFLKSFTDHKLKDSIHLFL